MLASSPSSIFTACAGTPSAVAFPASIRTRHPRRDASMPISATFADPLKSVCTSSCVSGPSARPLTARQSFEAISDENQLIVSTASTTVGSPRAATSGSIPFAMRQARWPYSCARTTSGSRRWRSNSASTSAAAVPHAATRACKASRLARCLSAMRTRSASSPSLDAGAVCDLANGTVNQKVLPRFGSLSRPISPPMSSTSCLQMLSPRPVPPYTRVVDPSA